MREKCGSKVWENVAVNAFLESTKLEQYISAV